MDPNGCLASVSGDGSPIPFLNGFVYGSVSFLTIACAAWYYTVYATAGYHPSAAVLASKGAWFGVPGAPTVALLTKLAIAFCVPQLVAFGVLTFVNGGTAGTALADMACVVGSGFPVMGALFGGIAILIVFTSPLRQYNRRALAVAAVGTRTLGARSPQSVVVIPAGRGVWIAPFATACVAAAQTDENSSTAGDDAPPKVTLLACDAFGTPQCPDSDAWLRHNIDADLLLDPGIAAAVDVDVQHVNFLRQGGRLHAADGSVDLVVAPFLWTTRSDVAAGESPAQRRGRIHALLIDARRVLAPGSGKLVAIVPFFRVGAAQQGLADAGYENVRRMRGLHWLTFLPAVLIEASAGGASSCCCSSSPANVSGAMLHPSEAPAPLKLTALSEIPPPALPVPWTPRTIARAAIFSATLLVGILITALLVRQLALAWLFLSDSVDGPSPGLPYAYRIAAASLTLQMNIPVGLLLLLDGAWAAADVLDAALTADSSAVADDVGGGDGVPLLAKEDALLAQHRQQGQPLRLELWIDLLSTMRCLLYSLVGAIVMSLIQWLPPFCTDMAWLAASPPATQDSMRTLNSIISAIVPFVLIQVAASRMEKAGGEAQTAATGGVQQQLDV